jgi:hypothetical protein
MREVIKDLWVVLPFALFVALYLTDSIPIIV